MDVERTPLPGIGLRHVLTTAKGRRVGLISHRNGRRDLVVFRRDDPESAAETVALSPAEANSLAELMGAARVVEHLAELHRQVEGLVSEQIHIEPGSRYDGKPLAASAIRTRTGASVVAVVRGSEVVASPRPDFVFAGGDVIVVVGTEDGAAEATAILHGG